MRAQRILRSVEGRTLALIQTGRLQKATLLAQVEELQVARQLDPAEVGIAVAMGSEYLLMSDFDRARATYLEALALEPRPEIHLNLGKASYAAEETERAVGEMRRAVRLDPALRFEVPAPIKKRVLEGLNAP